MVESEKPKSSNAELITATATAATAAILYQNLKVHTAGYTALVETINNTGNEIKRSQNLQSELLTKQLEVQTKLFKIDDSLREQVQISKKIEANQRTMIETQRQQSALLQKQVLLNEQQLIIQQQSLVAQELQARIAQNNENLRKKQKELKNVIFSFDNLLNEIDKKENNVVKYILIDLITKDFGKYKINPNDLEEITDKQYASRTFDKFDQIQELIKNSLTEEENKEIEFFKSYNESLNKLNQEIADVNNKMISVSQNIKYFDNRIIGIKKNFESENIRIKKYENKIRLNEEKREYNKRIPLSLISISSIIFVISLILTLIFKNNSGISIFTGVLVFFSIVTIVVSVTILIIMFFMNPTRIVKRNKFKINKIQRNIIILENTEKQINKDEEKYYSEYSSIKIKIEEKENELKLLNEKINDLHSKYPELSNLIPGK